MIGCLQTHVSKQPIIALYFESENELKFYNLEAWSANVAHVPKICCVNILDVVPFQSYDPINYHGLLCWIKSSEAADILASSEAS